MSEKHKESDEWSSQDQEEVEEDYKLTTVIQLYNRQAQLYAFKK